MVVVANLLTDLPLRLIDPRIQRGQLMAEVKLDAPAVEAANGPLREVARMFLKNHAAVGALAVLLLIVAAAVIGPPLYSDDPYEMVWAPFSPPGADGFC